MLIVPAAGLLFGGGLARSVVGRWLPDSQHTFAPAKHPEFTVNAVSPAKHREVTLNSLIAHASTHVPGGAAGSTAAPPGASAMVLSEETRKRLTRAASYSVTAHAHEQWEHEARDSAWASKFEQGVRTVFEDPELGSSKLVNVDCRTKVCRIEVTFDSNETFQKLVRISSAREPLSGTTGISDIEANRVVTYVTRTPQG
jgi:hypothetical protein